MGQLTLQQNKLHRIYTKYSLSINLEIIIDDNIENHIKNVLRIRDNEEIIIFNGNGKEFIGSVKYKKNTSIIIKKEKRGLKHNDNKIILAQCIPSYKYMDLAIQKSVELGVDEIIPVISNRSHPGNHGKKEEHWKKIIIHATEQSNGLFIPKLNNILTLDNLLEKFKNTDIYKICFHISGRKFKKEDKNSNSHLVLIGPEGGFNDNEINIIEKYNWNIITLGDRILRTETAAIVAQSLLRY